MSGCTALPVWCALLLLSTASPAEAQMGFGARNILTEQLTWQTWERHQSIMPMAGLSLIGPQWRAAGGFRLDWSRQPITVRLAGRWRLGPLGGYEPDVDQWYDLLRIVSFARYDQGSVYARVGPLRDMRLGAAGHIVNFYSSQAAWDARTVGVEVSLSRGPVTLEAFTGDVLLNQVSGGRLSMNLPRHTSLSANYVMDDRRGLHAWSADLHTDLFASGAIAFAPFVSYARYRDLGEGLAFGGDLRADDFIDLFSLLFRMGTFYNSRRFIPGFVGALYSVQNFDARIVRSGADLNDLTESSLAGTPMKNAHAAHQIFAELNLEIGRSFQFRYYWRNHFGTQPLSELHLRLIMRTGRYFEFELGMDQLGKRSFWSLFTELEDQTVLNFGSTFKLTGLLMIHVEARYSFEAPDDIRCATLSDSTQV